jgi:hypothetical protein
MWDLDTIRHINREAGERARSNGLEPFHLEREAQLDLMPPFPFPNLGDIAVELDMQHEWVDSLFVDKSGVGASDEPALTMDQFTDRLRELLRENEGGILLAIEEEGPFQLYVGVWR